MKKIFLPIAMLISLMLFSACSSDAVTADYATTESAEAPAAYQSDYGYGGSVDESYDMEMEIAVEESAASIQSGKSNADISSTSTAVELSEKIIYSADAHVETLDYDKTLDDIDTLAESYGGFIQSSSIGGLGIEGHGTRDASFTIRIPSSNFDMVTAGLSSLGSVLYCNTTAQNVTSEYFDIQSRLESYLIQEERLLTMLENATILEDMLTIEGYLSDVRYNIEYYQTMMNGLDTDVNYSTISIYISEVIEYTPEKPVTRTFMDRMGDAFSRSIDGIVDFSQNLVLFIILYWHVIIVLIVVVVVLTKCLISKKKALQIKKTLQIKVDPPVPENEEQK